jgi:hypothetical protein
MKLFVGLLTFLLALIISAVAAYFSVVGLAALFAGAFWSVVIMGSALEAGKLVAATWLKFNWHNPGVGIFHKTYLGLAVGVLMIVTALGIYGFLAKGHLEQEAPLASVELQIARIDQRVSQTREERERLDVKLKQLDQSINTILNNSKNTRDAQAGLRARQQQQKERDQIQKDFTARTLEINKLTDELVPLRTAANEVGAKLGPVKYVAKLFGWSDSNTAVQLVILLIMFAFDPLAVVLILSGTITMSEWFAQRRPKEIILPAAAPAAPVVDTPVVVAPDIIEPILESLIEAEGQSEMTEAANQMTVVMVPTMSANATQIEIKSPNATPIEIKSDKETLIEILERNPQLLSMLAEATEVDQVAEPANTEIEAETNNDIPVQAEVASVTETADTPRVGFTEWAREIVRGGSK